MLMELHVRTPGAGLLEITAQVEDCLDKAGVVQGLVTLFVQHTSCSILVQENADPQVRRDLETFFDRLVQPADDPSMAWVRHADEGPDDMPAHIKSMLNGVSLHVPVQGGALALGTWQGVYLVEHRAQPHRRAVLLQFIGSKA